MSGSQGLRCVIVLQNSISGRLTSLSFHDAALFIGNRYFFDPADEHPYEAIATGNKLLIQRIPADDSSD